MCVRSFIAHLSLFPHDSCGCILIICIFVLHTSRGQSEQPSRPNEFLIIDSGAVAGA